MIAPITEDEARSVVNVVCWRFGVKPPRVKWSMRARGGYYSGGDISIGPLAWQGVNTLLHEVAHHVAAMRAMKRRVGLERGHGPQFVKALKDVAQLWYGDYAAYPWETEYRSLRAAGRRENR